jgi:hypothetical protein
MADDRPDPLTNPEAFDGFLLDAVPSPGLAEHLSGGERKVKYEDQMAPGNEGAFTIRRGTELALIDYQLVLWAVEHFRKIGPYLDMIEAGRKKVPEKAYAFVDHRVTHNRIQQVVVSVVGALKKLAPGKWAIPITLKEFKKRKPSGGAVKAPKSDAEKKVEALSNENQALRQQMNSSDVAAKAGK